MSNITKPMMLDETGKQIVNAILSTDVTQARIAEINEAASAKQTEAISAIEAKGEEQLAKIPEVTELAGQVSSLSEECIKNMGRLPDGSDLNSITGNYIYLVGDSAGNQNVPTEEAGFITVKTVGSITLQTFDTLGGNRYTRHAVGETWSAWINHN